ncbi:hypothetical protein HDC37_002674 [Microbacterium sp. AK009]|uniref:DUF2971 domain-containing protein n=1 Tax=Microbacterium sp. AK009 TaxID=2723068 RepID=UPI0015CA7285|nr:DUF2971 domain-containing protein [Microbacterium sp. AK009]NYF17829.1 hypothetical protein [Microbacterium sp. AK009]
MSTPYEDIPPAPEGLVWHYTDGTGLLSILSRQVLWSTASGFLNDTSEVALGQRLLLERFQALADDDHELFRDIQQRLRQSTQTPRRSAEWFFILSASRSPDSLAMWRSYGGRGESYALGLDPPAHLKVLVADPGACTDLIISNHPWSPVRYDPAGQQELVSTVYEKFENELQRVMVMREHATPTMRQYLAALEETVEAASQALLLIKHPGFREEQETRHTTTLLSPLSPDRALAPVARFRHTAYGVTPYLELTGDSDDADASVTSRPAPLPIRAIAISPSPNGAIARSAVAALLTHHRMRDVPIISSRIPFRE